MCRTYPPMYPTTSLRTGNPKFIYSQTNYLYRCTTAHKYKNFSEFFAGNMTVFNLWPDSFIPKLLCEPGHVLRMSSSLNCKYLQFYRTTPFFFFLLYPATRRGLYSSDTNQSVKSVQCDKRRISREILPNSNAGKLFSIMPQHAPITRPISMQAHI